MIVLIGVAVEIEILGVTARAFETHDAVRLVDDVVGHAPASRSS